MYSDKLKIITAMLIWGSLGIFAVLLGWPPPIVASIRAIIGTAFGAGLMFFAHNHTDWREVRRAVPYLAVAGLAVGTNWILLFYGFKLTTVPVATLCYYMAPVYVLLASPFLFGERLGRLKIVCGIAAFIGTGLVSGIAENFSQGDFGDISGALYALVSGMLYALVMLLNKKVTSVPPQTKTLVQMGVAALAITPFALCTTDFDALVFSGSAIFYLTVLGLVHTGLAFHFFYSGVEKLPAQTTALLSYIDPVSAIILAAVILNQPLTFTQLIGGVLILGSTLVAELSNR